MTGLLDRFVMPLLILILALFGWDFYQFKSAPDSALNMKTNELAAVRANVEKLQNKIKEGQDFKRNFDQKREELRGIFTRLNEIKFSISEDIDPAAVMKSLASEAKIVGITISSVYPLLSKDQEYYVEYPFEMKFKGVFVQLIVFLKRLSALQSIITVEDVEIRSMGTSHSKYTDIEGTIRVKAYRYRASKADDLGGNPKPAVSPSPGVNK